MINQHYFHVRTNKINTWVMHTLKIILCNSYLGITCNAIIIIYSSLHSVYNTCDKLIHFPCTKYSIGIHLAKLHSYRKLHNYLCFILVNIYTMSYMYVAAAMTWSAICKNEHYIYLASSVFLSNIILHIIVYFILSFA